MDNRSMNELRAAVKRVFDAANAHDLDALRSCYASDARTRRPGWPREEGPEALLASYEMDFACVPDINFEPLSTVADGQALSTEARISGTNTGPTVLGDFGKALLGSDVEAVPPTGRPIDLPAVFIHEVRDGLVSVERQYWGLLEFLVQIGVVGE
jgi:ketosteroid isomerase-like protein